MLMGWAEPLKALDGLGRTVKGAGSCLIQSIRVSNPIFRTVDKLTGGVGLISRKWPTESTNLSDFDQMSGPYFVINLHRKTNPDPSISKIFHYYLNRLTKIERNCCVHFTQES